MFRKLQIGLVCWSVLGLVAGSRVVTAAEQSPQSPTKVESTTKPTEEYASMVLAKYKAGTNEARAAAAAVSALGTDLMPLSITGAAVFAAFADTPAGQTLLSDGKSMLDCFGEYATMVLAKYKADTNEVQAAAGKTANSTGNGWMPPSVAGTVALTALGTEWMPLSIAGAAVVTAFADSASGQTLLSYGKSTLDGIGVQPTNIYKFIASNMDSVTCFIGDNLNRIAHAPFVKSPVSKKFEAGKPGRKQPNAKPVATNQHDQESNSPSGQSL